MKILTEFESSEIRHVSPQPGLPSAPTMAIAWTIGTEYVCLKETGVILRTHSSPTPLKKQHRQPFLMPGRRWLKGPTLA